MRRNNAEIGSLHAAGRTVSRTKPNHGML